MNYIVKRKGKNDLFEIAELEKTLDITPITRSILLGCPETSIDIEKSFSRLTKLLRKDRRFNMDNVEDYMICTVNK